MRDKQPIENEYLSIDMVHSTIFSDFFFSIGIDIENGLMEM
jgi:hypothetical protein